MKRKDYVTRMAFHKKFRASMKKNENQKIISPFPSFDGLKAVSGDDYPVAPVEPAANKSAVVSGFGISWI